MRFIPLLNQWTNAVNRGDKINTLLSEAVLNTVIQTKN